MNFFKFLVLFTLTFFAATTHVTLDASKRKPQDEHNAQGKKARTNPSDQQKSNNEAKAEQQQ